MEGKGHTTYTGIFFSRQKKLAFCTIIVAIIGMGPLFYHVCYYNRDYHDGDHFPHGDCLLCWCYKVHLCHKLLGCTARVYTLWYNLNLICTVTLLSPGCISKDPKKIVSGSESNSVPKMAHKRTNSKLMNLISILHSLLHFIPNIQMMFVE